MTETTASRTTGGARRIIGLILLILAALTTVPAAIAGIAEAVLIPDAAPPEAFLLPGLAAWLMTFTWWLQAALIVVGLALVLTSPRRRVPAIVGIVAGVGWIIAIAFLVGAGMLSLPGA